LRSCESWALHWFASAGARRGVEPCGLPVAFLGPDFHRAFVLPGMPMEPFTPGQRIMACALNAGLMGLVSLHRWSPCLRAALLDADRPPAGLRGFRRALPHRWPASGAAAASLALCRRIAFHALDLCVSACLAFAMLRTLRDPVPRRLLHPLLALGMLPAAPALSFRLSTPGDRRRLRAELAVTDIC